MRYLKLPFFIYLCLFQTILFSKEEGKNVFTHLEGLPSCIVNGTVDVMTGNYYENLRCITIPGISDLYYDMSYSTGGDGTSFIGWSSNHHGLAKFAENSYGKTLGYLRTPYGSSKTFSLESKEADIYKLTPQTSPFSNNACAGELSGRSNPKNDRLVLFKTKGKMHITNGAGETYSLRRTNTETDKYKLSRFRKATGHFFKYYYGYFRRINQIRARNFHDQTLATIHLEYPETEQKVIGDTVKITADGASNAFFKLKKTGPHKELYITQIAGNRFPTLDFNHEMYCEPSSSNPKPRITQKILPRGYLYTGYYNNGPNNMGDTGFIRINARDNDMRRNRVVAQSAPVGPTNDPVVIHRFWYGENTTSVEDAYKNRKEYKFENNKLIKITRFDKNHHGEVPYSSECYFWGTGCDEGNLISTKLRDAAGNVKCVRDYIYDAQGNVIEDRYHGNLKGDTNPDFTHDEQGYTYGHPNHTFIKYFSYSNEGKNLPVEERDNRKTILYSYLEGTNLLCRKLIVADGGIKIRRFYGYDLNGALIKEIEDDGSGYDENDLTGVTERRITDIENSPVFPVGLPIVIVHKYLDLPSGLEKVLYKKTFIYSPEGWVKKQYIYDADDIYTSSMSWTYDAHGNVTETWNHLGDVTYQSFDSMDKLVREDPPRPGMERQFHYDFSNRLVAEEEIYTDGTRLKKSYSYNFLGDKTSETDFYGNVTRYHYDAFRRLVQIGTDGVEQLMRFHYNEMDQMILQTDTRGNETRKSYTSRGQLSKIIHPDGRQESNTYDNDGTLIKSVAADGTYIEHTIDYLERSIKQRVYSKDGHFLFETSSVYNAFHLLKEIDAEGNITEYEYDGAGRLHKVYRGDRITEKVYDTLGRIVKDLSYGPDYEGSCKETTYDSLDRIIIEKMCTLDGAVQKEEHYKYDCDGNKIEITRFGDAGPAVSTFEYDAHGNVTRAVDPEGNVTTTNIRYDYVNEFGYRVPYREVIDPKGNKFITKSDVLGRDSHIITKDAFNNILHETYYSYDNVGNRVRKKDVIYHDKEKNREIVKTWEYNSAGKIIRTVDAVGSPLQKEMTVSYNSVGQKEKVRKCDGTVISYKYNARGSLEEVISSDDSIHYQYTYDIADRPIRIEDKKSGTFTEKEYTRFGEVSFERLANGLCMQYTYDTSGRESTVTLPDGSYINYVYNGMHIERIDRFASDGTKKYTHSYTDYDLTGMLTGCCAALNAGEIRYEYDILSRLKRIETKHWREVIAGFDEVGNITEKEFVDSIGSKHDSFRYDSLNQLIKDNHNTYAYDSLNNRIAKNDKTHTINDLNQITYDGINSYEYDLNGNLTKISGAKNLTFLYDAFDRLIEVINETATYRYAYDANNRRVSKSKESSENSIKKYLYQGPKEIGEVNQNGEIRELRILGKGRGAEIGAAVALEIRNKIYIPIHDQAGNVVTVISGKTGDPVEIYRYSSFGEETIYKNSGREIKHPVNPWRFSSKRYDPETGFLYFGSRYYAPDLGKWTSADPLGERDGPNVYAYVKNNPLTFFDAYGLSREKGASAWMRKCALPLVIGCMAARFIASGLPGAGVEAFATHAMPPSIARHGMESLGLLMQGKDFAHEQTTWDTPTHKISVGEGYLDSGIRSITVTGIMCSIKETEYMAYSVSKHSRNTKVTGVCHASGGLFTDGAVTIPSKWGMVTQAVHNLANVITEEYDSARLESENPKIFLHAHSRGAIEANIAANLLPSNIRESLYINTYGGGTIMEDKGYGSLKNYMNPWDPIILFNPSIWYGCANVIWTDQPMSLNPLDNHYISSPGYQKAIKNAVTGYINKYGL